jgi:ABC-type transport system involved in multi-copper enzyme maturation permease subunit
MSPKSLGRIALAVFRESVRERVLYNLVGFALLVIGASYLIGQMTAGQDVKIIKDLGLSAMAIFGLFIAIFIGIGLVSKEVERRSIYSLLAKPLPRWEFIVGKYLGLVLTILVNLSLMTIAFYLMLAWMGWSAPANVKLSWEAPAVDPALLLAIALIFAEAALLTAIALFFSTFSSSTLLSLILTLGVWVAGIESQDLRQFGEMVESPAAPLVAAIGWIVPAFSSFDVKTAIVHGHLVPAGLVAWRLLYAFVYAAVAVGAGVIVFSRREFK